MERMFGRKVGGRGRSGEGVRDSKEGSRHEGRGVRERK